LKIIIKVCIWWSSVNLKFKHDDLNNFVIWWFISFFQTKHSSHCCDMNANNNVVWKVYYFYLLLIYRKQVFVVFVAVFVCVCISFSYLIYFKKKNSIAIIVSDCFRSEIMNINKDLASLTTDHLNIHTQNVLFHFLSFSSFFFTLKLISSILKMSYIFLLISN
jgi:hypothetical protein